MKYTTLSDDDMDVVQKFAFGGIANPIQRPFLRSADKEFLAARQAELDAFEQQRQAYNTGLAKYQEEVYKPYQQQAEAYNAAAKQYNTEVYEPYQQQFNAYEKAVSDFNAGDRTSDYAGPAEPTLARAFEMQAPTTPGSFDMTAPVLPFKEEDVVARQQQAAQTARKDAGNRATAINVASNPEQFGFGSMSVSNRFMAEGGPVDKDTGPSARDMLDGMSGSDDGKMDRVVRELSTKGGMSEEAIMDAVTRVSNAGRGGDELLAYLSPESMAFLKSQGGSGTVNPETGLPEFFIKSLIKAVQRAFGGGGSAPAPAPQAPPPPPTAAEQLAALQKSVDGLQSQLKETPEMIRVRRGFRKRTVENPAFAQVNSQLTTARGQLEEFMKTYKPEPAPAAPAPLPMSTAATAPTAPTAQQIANTPGMGTGGIGVNVQPLPMSTAATTPTVTRQQPLPPAPNPEALFNPPPPAFVGPVQQPIPPAPNPEALFNPPPPAFVGPVQQTPAAPPPPPPPVVRDPRAISGPAGGAASQTAVGPNAAALLSSINAARPLAAVELGRAVPGTTRPATGGQPTAPGAPPKQSGGLDTSYQPGAVAQPQFVDYSSRGVGSVGNVGTAQQNLSMPMFNDFQRSQAMQATRPSNYFAQSQPGTLGNTPGTTALGSGNAPLPMAFNTMNAIDANRNLSPGMLGGMQNAGVMTDRLGNRIFSPGMVPGFAKGGLAEAADVEEDDRPINTDPLGSAQQYMAQLTDANKPSPTRQSVKRLAKSSGGASAPKGMGMSTEPLASAKDLVPQLSDKGSSRQQMEELARVYQLKINAAKNKARGLAADTFGAPTLEGPALTKNTLAKKRFAKGGEAKKSDAVEMGENLSSQQETAKGGFFGGLFGGSKEDPLKGIKKTAEKNKDYRAILEYLKSRDAVPEIKSGYLPDPIDAVFSSVNLPLVGAVGKGQIKINKEIRGPDYETFLGPSTLAHEMTHAADRQLQEQAGEQSGMFSKGNQFTDAYEKMVGSGGMREGKKRTELARKYYPKFVSGNRDYRAAPHEIAAHGVGKYAGPTTADNAPPHVDATAATEFQILLDLARRNSGTSVKKRAEGSPEEGEVSQAELEAASKPAFVTPKSGKGRKSSAKAGELEAAALQGISETPYNLLGAPVDLATMAMRPFGYNVQAPMLGSEDLKRRATKAGIRQEPPKEGTAARALYNLAEIGSSAVNPAAPVRAGMKAAKAVGDKATDVAKDFQQYNQQLSAPGASYAVRPTGSTMASGPIGFNTRASGVDNLLNDGVSNARSAAGQDADMETRIKSFWDTKARNYFTRQFGTPDDPVMDAIAKKRIKSVGLEEMFPEYMIDQINVGKTRVNEQGQERFFPKYPRAMDDFASRYDPATGLKGNVISTDPAMANPQYEYILSQQGAGLGLAAKNAETDRMSMQGLRPELINTNVEVVTRSGKNPDRVIGEGTKSAEGLLRAFEEAQAYNKLTPEQQRSWANEQFGMGRGLHGLDQADVGKNILPDNIRTAIEKGEPVYDFDKMDKPLKALFEPASINAFLATVPAREMKNLRFEDAVAGAVKMNELATQRQVMVDRIKAGKSVPDKVFSDGVSAPLLQFGEGSGLDGFAWKRIEKREATVPEGAYVRHSVGGYELGGAGYSSDKREGFNTGLWQVYTLRDNRNRPVNTIEVKMLDETTPVVTQIKGNGRATGNTAPEKYDGAVLRFLQDYLKPAAIKESDSYLTPLLQNYKTELGASPRVR